MDVNCENCGQPIDPKDWENNNVKQLSIGLVHEECPNKLLISNCPNSMNIQLLRQLFTPFGVIIDASINNEYALIQYDNKESLQSAINIMHGFVVGTNKLSVTKYTNNRSNNDEKKENKSTATQKYKFEKEDLSAMTAKQIASLLVPRSKIYKHIYKEWMKLIIQNKSEVIEFMYYSKANSNINQDIFNYIAIPDYLKSLISNKRQSVPVVIKQPVKYNKDVITQLVQLGLGTKDECIKASAMVINFNDINEISNKLLEIRNADDLKEIEHEMQEDAHDINELNNILESRFVFMDKYNSVVDELISSSTSSDLLFASKEKALKIEKELLQQIMTFEGMNEFLNDIILIENRFNFTYTDKIKMRQQIARKTYAKNIDNYEGNTKPKCFVDSFVELLFRGTNLNVGEFSEWLKSVEDECKEKNIKIVTNSGAKGKKIERAFYKAFYVYGGDGNHKGFQEITDILRCSLVFDDFNGLYQCFNVIEELSKKHGGILRCKDRFNPSIIEFGYRDLLINVYCPESKIVCEIQLHHVIFYKYKKISHEMYKKARLFEQNEINIAYKYADKHNRKHIGNRMCEITDDETKTTHDEKQEEFISTPYELLQHWKLEQYGKILIDEQGYDDVDDWKDLTVDELINDLHFKPGHAKKFVRFAAEMNLTGVTIK